MFVSAGCAGGFACFSTDFHLVIDIYSFTPSFVRSFGSWLTSFVFLRMKKLFFFLRKSKLCEVLMLIYLYNKKQNEKKKKETEHNQIEVFCA